MIPPDLEDCLRQAIIGICSEKIAQDVQIDGLLGFTVDDSQVLLFKINQVVRASECTSSNEAYDNYDPSSQTPSRRPSGAHTPLTPTKCINCVIQRMKKECAGDKEDKTVQVNLKASCKSKGVNTGIDQVTSTTLESHYISDNEPEHDAHKEVPSKRKRKTATPVKNMQNILDFIDVGENNSETGNSVSDFVTTDVIGGLNVIGEIRRSFSRSDDEDQSPQDKRERNPPCIKRTEKRNLKPYRPMGRRESQRIKKRINADVLQFITTGSTAGAKIPRSRSETNSYINAEPNTENDCNPEPYSPPQSENAHDRSYEYIDVDCMISFKSPNASRRESLSHNINCVSDDGEDYHNEVDNSGEDSYHSNNSMDEVSYEEAASSFVADLFSPDPSQMDRGHIRSIFDDDRNDGQGSSLNSGSSSSYSLDRPVRSTRSWFGSGSGSGTEKSLVTPPVAKLHSSTGWRSSSRMCHRCDNCERRDDCQECKFCLDKPKYGGPGVKKQKCEMRQCIKLSRHWQRMMEMSNKTSKLGNFNVNNKYTKPFKKYRNKMRFNPRKSKRNKT